jgi:hypothetical protein
MASVVFLSSILTASSVWGSVFPGRFGFNLEDAEGVAYSVEVRNMLHLQYERYCAVDDGLHEVYWRRLAVGAIDTSRRVLKVGDKACNVLAEWGGPCKLLRPRCRHSTSVAVGATARCWLVNWLQELPLPCDRMGQFQKSSSRCL